LVCFLSVVDFDFIIRGRKGKGNGKMVENRQLSGEKSLNRWLENVERLEKD